jgi:hemolysin activation/secretion protein
VPGTAISASLRPGSAVGTSDLEVQVSPTQAVNGNVTLDSNGNAYTGRARLGGTMNLNNPFNHGDVLSASVLSTGNGMNYARLGYDTLLDGAGTRLGGAYSNLNYVLGDSLTSLNGHGTAQVSSLWLKRPFIRSREVNFNGQIALDHKNLQDELDASNIHTKRHLDNVGITLSGDTHDALLAGGVNGWTLAMTSGQVLFDDAAALQTNSATARTQGAFTKWTGNWTRLQGLSSSIGLYISFSGQWASTNLDSAEKMIAGGPYSVRAYDMGVLSGDCGYVGSIELRHDLGSLWQGQWQAVAFVDSQHITINKAPWTTGTNDATLSGVGAGLDWSGQDQWSGKLYVATPVGGRPELVSSPSKFRAWVQLSKGF